MRTTAKVFMSGSSQAVRLPKAFRLAVDEVRVTRMGTGLLLTPVEPDIRQVFAAIDRVGGEWPDRPPQGRERKRRAF
jgi:antitoxin VapB